MAIRGPKGAHPTKRGWVNPKTGELLKSQKISQEDIDAFFGVVAEPAPAPVETDDVVEDYNQDGVIDEIESMTKVQIEEYGRTIGIELDRRKSKATMIEDLKAFMNA